MSKSIDVYGIYGKVNPEFLRHYGAVKYCIENNLSFPIETSEFFKGKLRGENLEDIRRDKILKYLEDGIQINIPLIRETASSIIINIDDIPAGTDCIRIYLT